MNLFPWLKKRDLFDEEEKKLIVEAVQSAETRTSGEVRVFVEKRCKFVDAFDRATELFHGLKMDQTTERNAVLVYVAIKDHQLAIFGDEGIHRKVGDEFWARELIKMIRAFNRENYAEGIRQCVCDIGEVLHRYFPYANDTDKNELPDDIVFGK